MRYFILSVATLLFLRAVWITLIPIHRPPGVLVPDEPTQVNYTSPQPVMQLGAWTLKPLALYSIKGRVIGTSRMGMDGAGDISKYDLALGWGCMSDSAVLDQLSFFQAGRFVQWRYPAGGPPRPEREIESHIGHIHVIPADDTVAGAIAGLREGALIYLTGDLVEAQASGFSPWRSSMTRTDTGDGACEIMYVRSAVELD